MPRPIVHPDLKDVSLAAMLHALSDPVRLSIVAMASREDGLPCRAFEQEIPKSTMSHHWHVLRSAGLIRQEGRGTQRINSLRRAEINKRFPGLLETVLSQVDAADPPDTSDKASGEEPLHSGAGNR